MIHEEKMKRNNNSFEPSEVLLEQVEDESTSDELLDKMKKDK